MRGAAGLCAILMLLARPAHPAQNDPGKDGLPEDPQFPVQAFFGRTDNDRRDWAVRAEDATLVVLGGPGRDWFVGWDLVTGQQKYRVRAPHLPNNVDHREMGPTGKHLFYLPKEETGKDGRKPRLVQYFDTTTGKLVRTASFDVTSPPQYKLQGNSLDERVLLERFGGGFHPKQTALMSFERQSTANRGLVNRAFTPDLLIMLGNDQDRKSLFVIDAEKPKVIAELPLAPLNADLTAIVGADLSPDRSTMILRTAGNTLGVVELSKKKLARSLVGHSNSIFAGFRISPDSTRVISASLDGSARLWDVALGKELAQLPTDRAAEEVGFVTAGEKAGYVVDEHSLRLLKYDGTLLRTVGTFLSARAELTEDGRSAFDGTDGTQQTSYRFWKLDPPQVLWEHRLPGRRGFAALSADGQRALVEADNTFHLLDAPTRTVVWTGKVAGMPVGLLPGGAVVLSIQQKTLVAVDVATGEKRWSTDLPEAPLGGRLNAPGTHCVVRTAFSARVVETAQGRILSANKAPGPNEDRSSSDLADLTRDGETVVTHHPSTRTVQWRSIGGDSVRSQTYPQNAGGVVSISPDGRRAYLTSRGRVAVLSPEKGIEKTYAFDTGGNQEIRMCGDSAVVQTTGASVLLRYVPAPGK